MEKGCNKYFECSSCVENRMSPDDVKRFLGLLNGNLIYFKDKFEHWTPRKNKELPDFAIFIPKKNKTISYIFCQKFSLKEKIYYVQTIEV